MFIGFSKDPGAHKYNNKNKFEFVIFKYGFIWSTTSLTLKTIDIYDSKEDKVIRGDGLLRVSHTFKFIKRFPFIKRDNVLKQNIPLSLL